MKKLLILLAMVFASYSSNISKIKEAEADMSIDGYKVSYTSKSRYGAIDPGSKVEINGTISLLRGEQKTHLYIKYELFSIYENEGKSSYQSDYLSKEFTYKMGSIYRYSFFIDDKYDYARDGIKVRVGVYWAKKEQYISYIERTLYSKKEETISIDDISGSLEYDNIFSLEENTERKEIYEFNDYSHILELDKYYELDLASFSFIYDFISPFRYEEAYLSFIDKNNLFPNISSKEDKKIIKLILNQNKKDVSFSYDKLYVEPDSFDLSSKALEGYKETTHFLLPKNKKHELQGYTFYINVIKMGYNNISFHYDFTINSSSLLIGPCNESNYCVVGGVRL